MFLQHKDIQMPVAYTLMLLWIAGIAEADFLGLSNPMFFTTQEIDMALQLFYNNTKGPTDWPKQFRGGWDSKIPCAWDGNERAHGAPWGCRCLNGGWHPLPPRGDGGLLFLEHYGGGAEGEVPWQFRSFQMTDIIGIAWNKLHGPIWNTSYHTFCHRFDLSHNRFSGPLGDDFMQRNEKHSEVINLSFNEFDGPIPPKIANLLALNAILFNHNRFSGTLPDLSPLRRLRQLNVGFNSLSGSIGSWMKEMPNLAWVHLEYNKFEGSLPELGPRVSHFYGSGNPWSGKIPMSYGQLGYLRVFNCTGCNVECPVPDLLDHVYFSTHCKPTKRYLG
jgi:hypothetical protein